MLIGLLSTLPPSLLEYRSIPGLLGGLLDEIRHTELGCGRRCWSS
jgi:hypothetical protein